MDDHKGSGGHLSRRRERRGERDKNKNEISQDCETDRSSKDIYLQCV